MLKVLEVLVIGVFLKVVMVMIGGNDIIVFRNVEDLKIKVIFEYCNGMFFKLSILSKNIRIWYIV